MCGTRQTFSRTETKYFAGATEIPANQIKEIHAVQYARWFPTRKDGYTRLSGAKKEPLDDRAHWSDAKWHDVFTKEFLAITNPNKSWGKEYAQELLAVGLEAWVRQKLQWTLEGHRAGGGPSTRYLVTTATPPQAIDRVIKWERKEKQTMCGAKCRNAKGPNCDCICEGKYHGAGMTNSRTRFAAADIDLKPTAEMAANAARGLELREKHGKGGTAVGVARARDIKNRANLSPSTVKRMHSFFSRHEGNQKGGEDDAGYIAWLLWGGDAGKAWAARKSEQLDKSESARFSHDIRLPKGKRRLNIDEAHAALAQMGYKLGTVRYDPAAGGSVYKVTQPNGAVIDMPAAKLTDFIYEKAKHMKSGTKAAFAALDGSYAKIEVRYEFPDGTEDIELMSGPARNAAQSAVRRIKEKGVGAKAWVTGFYPADPRGRFPAGRVTIWKGEVASDGRPYEHGGSFSRAGAKAAFSIDAVKVAAAQVAKAYGAGADSAVIRKYLDRIVSVLSNNAEGGQREAMGIHAQIGGIAEKAHGRDFMWSQPMQNLEKAIRSAGQFSRAGAKAAMSRWVERHSGGWGDLSQSYHATINGIDWQIVMDASTGKAMLMRSSPSGPKVVKEGAVEQLKQYAETIKASRAGAKTAFGKPRTSTVRKTPSGAFEVVYWDANGKEQSYQLHANEERAIAAAKDVARWMDGQFVASRASAKATHAADEIGASYLRDIAQLKKYIEEAYNKGRGSHALQLEAQLADMERALAEYKARKTANASRAGAKAAFAHSLPASLESALRNLDVQVNFLRRAFQENHLQGMKEIGSWVAQAAQKVQSIAESAADSAARVSPHSRAGAKPDGLTLAQRIAVAHDAKRMALR